MIESAVINPGYSILAKTLTSKNCNFVKRLMLTLLTPLEAVHASTGIKRAYEFSVAIMNN